MKNSLKKNLAILLAFILPIALISVVILNTYLPSLFLKTDYNFIYAACTDGSNYTYNCQEHLRQRYTVVNGKLVLNPVSLPTDKKVGTDAKDSSVRIFLHDTEKNESREVTFEEAQGLNLSSLLSSPDGVTVSRIYDEGVEIFPVFDSNSSYGYYLVKGKSQKRINLINDGGYYGHSFKFLGWVLPGRGER